MKLREIGIQPDILVCRTDRALARTSRTRSSLFLQRGTGFRFHRPRRHHHLRIAAGAPRGGPRRARLRIAQHLEPGARLERWERIVKGRHPAERGSARRHRRQVRRPDRELQVAERGRWSTAGSRTTAGSRSTTSTAPPSRPRAPKHCSRRPTRCWCRADSAFAARRARSRRSATPANAKFRSLEFVSVCKWPLSNFFPQRPGPRGAPTRSEFDEGHRPPGGQPDGRSGRPSPPRAAPCGSAPTLARSSRGRWRIASTARKRSASATATASRSTTSTGSGWKRPASSPAASNQDLGLVEILGADRHTRTSSAASSTPSSSRSRSRPILCLPASSARPSPTRRARRRRASSAIRRPRTPTRRLRLPIAVRGTRGGKPRFPRRSWAAL